VAVLAAIGIPEAGDALDEAIAADLESMLDVRIDALDNPRAPGPSCARRPAG
jgi:hypothetical protein